MGEVGDPFFSQTRRRLVDLYQRLEAAHGSDHWHWWPDVDPFEVVVGCILVQNTAWDNVEKALARLRPRGALDPAVMSALPDEELEELIRPSGVYRNKARKLRAFLDMLNGQYEGYLERLLALPPEELRQVLLATWGIGRETADAIILYGARKPVFVMDAYTMRLFTRLGLTPPSDGRRHPYETWKAWFERHLEADRTLYSRYHALIVIHCKKVCRARPRCDICPLRSACAFGTLQEPGPNQDSAG